MSKTKTVYTCSNCGTNSPKWIGKCNSCGEWNTYQEEILSKPDSREQRTEVWRQAPKSGNRPIPLPEIEAKGISRQIIPDGELMRVLGGGIVPGSIVLIGGQPGIGKSTLLLQVAVSADLRVLYVSGEESEEQIKMRADRIGPPRPECYILTETNTEKILKHAKDLHPDFVVIDSIQTLSSPYLESTPGSIAQVRESAGEMQRFAKETGIPVFLIGHINKEGSIAGPKLLEHIVDTVLQFEGDRHHSYRILRTLKNRFGSTDEMGIYEMQSTGLREVSNPSELFLAQKDQDLSGSAVGATMEGMRPMLIETQGLVSSAVFGNPQRTATGFDLRRMGMLLAVLEKRCHLPFGQNDVFLNIAGGIRVSDPAIDLAVVCALISSLHDIPVPHDYCFAGEVGLSGEIRAVTRAEQRVQEADRLGFTKIFISKYNSKGLDLSKYQIQINLVGKLDELLDEVFGL